MYGLERKRLGDILVEAGFITVEQLGEALEEQKTSGIKLGKVLVAKGFLTEYDILGALSHQTEIPLISLKETVLDPEILMLLPEKIARKYGILAIERKHGAIVIAVSDPFSVQGIDEARMALNCDVDLVLTPSDEIAAALDEHFAPMTSLEGILGSATADDLEVIKEGADLTKQGEVEDNQIVKVVNALILEAIKNRASDVHIEPFEHEFQVRQRLDGVLHKMPSPPRSLQSAVTSRIKVMANLNISESRLPQDGRLRLKLAGKEIDMRVSTLPTVFGESVVMRILDRGATILTLEQLGMAEPVWKKTEKVIENPNGIFVVTGPTGCGKTSTLYACIEKLNDPDDKVITVEDPVEYEVEGLVQVPVNEKVGMTFGAALRSILRQDPDTVVIGEMRDVETAEISVQASLTGHLVLSTLHTNQAAGALTRLIDMGIEPFLLSSTMLGICGQRLVRVVCPMCKEPHHPSEAALKQIAPEGEDWSGATFMKGRGCPDCTNTGFRGRTGIFELLVVTPEIEEMILEKAASNLVHSRAVEMGMQSMMADGWAKAKAGITTLEEVLRVAPLDLKRRKKDVEVE